MYFVKTDENLNEKPEPDNDSGKQAADEDQEIIRNVLYEGMAPSVHYTGRCLLITGITVILAIIVYRKTRNGFISNL